MNKLVLLILLQLPLALYAQNKVQETMVKKGSEKVPGYVATYKHSRTLTKETMAEMVKGMNLKRSNHKKGFNAYKGAVWQSISANKGDYYYKVGGKRISPKYIL